MIWWSYFDDLSDCLLLKIFKHCTEKTDLRRARCVCKRFHRVLTDCELWQVCDLSDFKLDHYPLLMKNKYCTPFHTIKHLEINSKKISLSVLHGLLQLCVCLEALRMNHSQIINEKVTIQYKLKQSLMLIDVGKIKGNIEFLAAILTQIGHSIQVLGKFLSYCFFDPFWSNIPFLYPRKMSKIKDFLTFSGSIEMEH